MLGCSEIRADQLDGRKRYCALHSELSYFQRWRLKRDRRAEIAPPPPGYSGCPLSL